jgi:uncharacterized membrane protein YjjP (DUF1212 family)
MRYTGITIFLLFFGISLLDALWGGHWLRALLWIIIGLVFYAMDNALRWRSASPDKPAEPPGP